MYDDDTMERIKQVSNIVLNPIWGGNWYFEGEVMESQGESSIHFLVTNNMALLERFLDGDTLENREEVIAHLVSISEEEFPPILGVDGLDPNSEEGRQEACFIDIDTGRWEYRILFGEMPKDLETFLQKELLTLREQDLN